MSMFRSFRNSNIWYQSTVFPLPCSAHVKMPEEKFFWQLLILTFLMETEIRNHWVIEFLSFLSLKHQFWTSKSRETVGFPFGLKPGRNRPGWRLKKHQQCEKTTCRFASGNIKRHVVSVEAPSCKQPQNDMSFSFGNENDMSFPVNTY